MNPSPDNLELAVVQMVSGPDVHNNLQAAQELLAQAAEQGAQMVVLPEFFPLLGADEEVRIALAEWEGEGMLQTFLATQARTLNLWLVGGTIPLKDKDPASRKVRNSCLVFNPQGQRVALYDKIHLFNFHSTQETRVEKDFISAGNTPVRFASPCGDVAIGICYDLRFPELFRALGRVNLMVLPAAFTVPTGAAHWELLLRSRAVENQCYVAAAAQGGTHPGGRKTYGHSMIIDPWGQVVSSLPSGEGVVRATVEQQRLTDVRQMLPALDNRRQDVFTFLP